MRVRSADNDRRRLADRCSAAALRLEDSPDTLVQGRACARSGMGVYTRPERVRPLTLALNV